MRLNEVSLPLTWGTMSLSSWSGVRSVGALSLVLVLGLLPGASGCASSDESTTEGDDLTQANNEYTSTMRDLDALLPAGALLVVNDTRVLAARLLGHKAESGGRAEIFLVRREGALSLDEGGRSLPAERWRAMGRASKPLRPGGRIQVRTRAHRGMVEVTVINTLGEEPGRQGSGIALANVADRLRLLHDVAASLNTGVEDGLYKARIVVPL